MTRGIEAQIARCESCVGGPIFPDWLPVSYFGDYRCSNAWVLSINPSHREFIDRNAQALEGTAWTDSMKSAVNGLKHQTDPPSGRFQRGGRARSAGP